MDKADKRLVNAIQTGDAEAFETLFVKYYQALWRFARRYVDSEAIGEDLVQEVYATIWEKRDQLAAVGNIRPYLYRAVKNKALDYRKHEEVREKYERQVELQLYDTPYETAAAPRTNKGFTEAAQNAIEDLPDHTRHIYTMSRSEGLTYPEIAHILDISVKTVEAHISRALRMLRKRLAPYLPGLFAMILFC
jgi:RNA polymerase sigma-70 factor (ECF subfamily)